MHLPSSLALLLAALFLTLFIAVMGQEHEGRVPNRIGRDLAIDDSNSNYECPAHYGVQLEGRVIMESTNNIVRNPEQCCAQCQDRSDCDGWMFRATYHGCTLYSRVRTVLECETADCVAGGRRNETLELMSTFDDVLLERYRGPFLHLVDLRLAERLVMTCGQRRLYELITVVASACSEVHRRCNPAKKKVELKEFDLNHTLPEIVHDVNLFLSDYNNGFQEHTLTPEDCRMKCMRQRRCHAWSRTQPGQCWLKEEVPDKKENITGDATGTRTPLGVRCGPSFTGVAYNTTNKHFRDQKEAEGPDKCCNLCKNLTGCVVWTYLDGICHFVLNDVGERKVNENAISGFLVTAPLKCDDDATETNTTELRDIAAAYDVECASILEYGPAEPKDRCEGRPEAIDIFDKAKSKVLEALSR